MLLWGLCFAILFARRPSALLRPQLWAEDGAIFYHDRLVLGFSSIWQPYAGYLHIISRLIAALAGFFSARWTPLCYGFMALFVSAFCCSEFSSPRYRRLLRSDALRLALCIVISAAFPCYELIGNIANLQWFILAAAVPFVLASDFGASASAALAGFIVGALISLSAPGLVIVVPILLAIRFRHGRLPPVAVGAIAGAVLQLILFVRGTPAGTVRIEQTLLRVGKATAVALSNQVILPSLIGQRHAFSLATKGPDLVGPIVLAIFFAFVIFLCATLPANVRLQVVGSVWLLLSSLAVPLAARKGVGERIEDFHHAIRFGADRYFFCGCCLFAYCLAVAFAHWASRAIDKRPMSAMCFACLFLLSGFINFRIGALGDLCWPVYAPRIDEWSRCKRTGAPHAALSIPVSPEPWHIDLPSVP